LVLHEGGIVGCIYEDQAALGLASRRYWALNGIAGDIPFRTSQ
jgi:hypothetical protein